MDVLHAARSLLGSFSFLESHDNDVDAEETQRLPWHASNISEQPYERVFKHRILQLSQDETAFMTNAADYQSVHVEIAMADNCLKEDPQLRQLRFKLVPKHISEERFWRVYFGKVAKAKEAVLSGEDTAESGFIYLPDAPCTGSLTDRRKSPSAVPQLSMSAHSNSVGALDGEAGSGDSLLCGMQCNSQASSITEAMLMSPRSQNSGEVHMREAEGSRDVRQDNNCVSLGGVCSSELGLVMENEDSQFAQVDEGEEDAQSSDPTGLPESTRPSSYGGWVLL